MLRFRSTLDLAVSAEQVVLRRRLWITRCRPERWASNVGNLD